MSVISDLLDRMLELRLFPAAGGRVMTACSNESTTPCVNSSRRDDREESH